MKTRLNRKQIGLLPAFPHVNNVLYRKKESRPLRGK
jgi:hypothetical protein